METMCNMANAAWPANISLAQHGTPLPANTISTAIIKPHHLDSIINTVPVHNIDCPPHAIQPIASTTTPTLSSVAAKILVYFNVYVEDFIALDQGDTIQLAAVCHHLFRCIGTVFHPNNAKDPTN
eukprot:8237931-Ditylum_brightwellii.AAC.3